MAGAVVRKSPYGFVLSLWLAFIFQGAFHAIVAPMWDGFDEPGHLAYVLFIDDHGRPPGFAEPSFPRFFVDVNSYLPSTVGHGAPSFAAWRNMSPGERQRNRAVADQLARDPNRYRLYISGNYERQQGPVFYYLAAIPAYFLRWLSLPKVVVAMRLFCVLLASLAVPLSALALRLLDGQAAVLVGLPIVALAPNTLFAFDRISNEALVFPLMAAIAYALIAVTKRGSRRDCWQLGAFAAVGVWSRFTIVAVLPAVALALISGRVRRGRWLTALGLPMGALAVLLAWNHAQSGHMSGVIERTAVGVITVNDLERAWARLKALPVVSELVKNHLWCGGWGFVKPSGGVYVMVLTVIGMAAGTAWLRRRRPLPSASWPLVLVIAAYLMAMTAHIVNGAIAAVKDPAFPTIGAEGWYLDETRPMEAALLALVACAALASGGVRLTSIASTTLLAGAGAAGTILLLLPHWGGVDGQRLGMDAFRAAVEAAPIRRFVSLPLAIVACWLTALIFAITEAWRRRDAVAREESVS